MGILKKIFGICNTKPPTDETCWRYSDGKIEIGLDLAPELSNKGGAVRLEGRGLPGKILVFHGNDNAFHALKNKCTHIGGRRVDPMGDAETIKCCSVMGTTYNYEGDVISGPSKTPLTTYKTEKKDGKIIVSLN